VLCLQVRLQDAGILDLWIALSILLSGFKVLNRRLVISGLVQRKSQVVGAELGQNDKATVCLQIGCINTSFGV